VPLRRITVDDGSALTVDGQALAYGTHWGILGPRPGAIKAGGEVVFIGYGAVDERRNDLAGVDVAGKVVVMLQDPPATTPPDKGNDFLNARKARLDASKAAALVIIGTGRGTYTLDFLVDMLARPSIQPAAEPPAGAPAPASTAPPALFVTDATADVLFAKARVPRKVAIALAERDDFKAMPLGRSATLDMKASQADVTGYNVVGVLEGADPAARADAVAFSGHYDAYGVIRGKIYNGAGDNALGTAEMLAVAEAFAKSTPRPARSLLFMAFTAEESGLLGSRHFMAHPTWPLDHVVANLNLDGIGTEIFGPVKSVIGFGAEHSTLGALMQQVLDTAGIGVMPDPLPEQNIFTRSDHYPFVLYGVPALMLVGAPAGSKDSFIQAFTAFEAKHYHQPSDDIYPTWHWPGAKTVADVMGILGRRLGAPGPMPSWLPSSPYAKSVRGQAPKPDGGR
jgi:hypothetical protein